MVSNQVQEQLLGLFFEESAEAVETLEAGLLRLDEHGQSKDDDPELINDIFRAAHSIKGGAGTFGLNSISDLTHIMETLLDEVRDGTRPVSPPLVSTLLSSVDCLHSMLEAARDGSPIDTESLDQAQDKLRQLLKVRPVESIEQSATAPLGPFSVVINFSPFAHMLHTGNDALPLLRELGELARDDFTVVCDASRLPTLSDLVPEDCHLAWKLTFTTTHQLTDIDEIFSWVEGDCTLDIAHVPLHEFVAGTPENDDTASETIEEGDVAAIVKSKTRGQSSSNNTAVGAGSIRVSIDKIDALMNMVGELVITQSMLGEIDTGSEITTARLEHLRDGLGQLARNTRELQESVMRIRSMPISIVFSRFPRLVHDTGQRLGKKVALKLVGEGTELDKTVLEKLGDPLVHLVRNALDHGLESPDVRLAAKKPEVGTLELNAYHMGGNIIIRVRDDGRGINTVRVRELAVERNLLTAEEAQKLSEEEAVELIFRPGFSTVSEVSDLSGRGVGMDVVRQNIRSLGGSISIESEPGVGTSITIRLPLTLAILEGQIIRVGEQNYIIPLVSIIESTQVRPEHVNHIAGRGNIYRLRNEPIPIIDLHKIFGLRGQPPELNHALLVVVEADGQRVGLLIDELLAQQQVVIKNLDDNYGHVPGVAGATILGNGIVSLILDPTGLVDVAHQHLVNIKRPNTPDKEHAPEGRTPNEHSDLHATRAAA